MRLKFSAPVATFLVLLAVYALTLAPGVTLWDSGEFLAAVKTLGIPHPAGTPLYVLVAKCWSFVFAPLIGFARAINLFSAATTAAACAIIASLFAKWTRSTAIGLCAGILAGGMSTVWMSATETEVYGPAMLLGCLILYAADRCGRTGDSRWGFLAVYLSGLAIAMHLSSFVVVPSALLLAFADRDGHFGIPPGRRRNDGRRAGQTPVRLALAALALFVLGATCVAFLIIRARHDPAINQGNPSTLASLWDVLSRKQYGGRSLWPRAAPLYLQIGNLFEYADWQFALGLSSDPGPSFVRTSITVAFALLAVVGCKEHHRIDRRSWRAWLALLVVAFLGVILYLNMKPGPSFGAGLVAEGIHEARERDYFFFFAFVAWAGWAALGAVRLTKRLTSALASAPFIVAALPIALNWGVVDRWKGRDDTVAREMALTFVHDLPPNAVMLAIGDNDTYPIWYLQQVEHIRRDVTVVTIPLLSASWYRAELARRYQLLDPNADRLWLGSAGTEEQVIARAATLSRPVVLSPFLSTVRQNERTR
jgi:hypothetical protein